MTDEDKIPVLEVDGVRIPVKGDIKVMFAPTEDMGYSLHLTCNAEGIVLDLVDEEAGRIRMSSYRLLSDMEDLVRADIAAIEARTTNGRRNEL